MPLMRELGLGRVSGPCRRPGGLRALAAGHKRLPKPDCRGSIARPPLSSFALRGTTAAPLGCCPLTVGQRAPGAARQPALESSSPRGSPGGATLGVEEPQEFPRSAGILLPLNSPLHH